MEKKSMLERSQLKKIYACTQHEAKRFKTMSVHATNDVGGNVGCINNTSTFGAYSIFQEFLQVARFLSLSIIKI